MSVTYTNEGITMCLCKLQVHCTFDVTKVEHSCVIDEVFARCSLSLYSNEMSITYTYESNTMYLHTLKVHINIDVT